MSDKNIYVPGIHVDKATGEAISSAVSFVNKICQPVANHIGGILNDQFSYWRSKNALVCWNYLYYTQEINNEPNHEKRQQMIEALKNHSMAIWEHFNFLGEYDFSDEKLEGGFCETHPKVLIGMLTQRLSCFGRKGSLRGREPSI